MASTLRACACLLAALAAFAAADQAAAAPAKAAPAAPRTLTLLALNDFHGNVLPPGGSVLVPDPDNPAGTRVSAGGAAYLATLVRSLRQHNPRTTLVVAAGDMIGASQLTSGLFHDEPTIDVLGQIGLDIASVGNHEFDKGRDELLRMQHGGCFPKAADGSAGVVGVDTCMNQGRFTGARFQYLAANVRERSSGKTLFPATSVRALGGVKVGFIGLTLAATPSIVTPAGVQGLEFDDEVQTVNRLVPELQRRGATVIVVLIHQGGETRAKTALDKSCPGFSGPILDLADRFDKAVDLIVSGHTHQEYVCFRPDGKLLTQSGSYGRMLTKIDLTIDRSTGKVIAKDATNHLVHNDAPIYDAAGNPVRPPAGRVPLLRDAGVERVVRRYGDLSATIADAVVGRIAGPLDRKPSAGGETTLGAVIADAFLAGSSDSSYGERPAQIAFTNRASLRSDLSSLSVNFGQLFNAMPFNNNLVTMDLSGAQLLRLLEQQWESPQPTGGSRMLAVSKGFGYSWDASMPEGAPPGTGRRVLAASMQLHGKPIEMEQVYRVTVNSFMASGGDGYTVLRQGSRLQSGEIDSVVAKLYLRTRGVVELPALDRISRLN